MCTCKERHLRKPHSRKYDILHVKPSEHQSWTLEEYIETSEHPERDVEICSEVAYVGCYGTIQVVLSEQIVLSVSGDDGAIPVESDVRVVQIETGLCAGPQVSGDLLCRIVAYRSFYQVYHQVRVVVVGCTGEVPEEFRVVV